MTTVAQVAPEHPVIKAITVISVTLVVLAVIASLVYMAERSVALPVQPEIGLSAPPPLETDQN